MRDDWNAGLSTEDAGLAHAILGLCLRRWGSLSAWHTSRLNRPSRGIPVETQIALNIGLSQLAWLPGVASHAAVDESVSLVSISKTSFPPHKGLVNAMLRSAASDRKKLALELDSMPQGLDRQPFLERMVQAALGDRFTDRNAAILQDMLLQPPSLAFVVLSGDAPECLMPDSQFKQAWRIRPGAQFPTAWLRSGAGMVQDISSQALMGFDWHFEKPESMRILDVCAAPGGKTTALAKRWPSAKIFALENHPARAKRLRDNLAARKVNAQVEEAESIAWIRRGGRPFDLILLDAPCSASGTIRKHPELNWIGDYSDIGRLASIQRDLLSTAISRLSSGGLLIYSVCSWFQEEGIGHIASLQSSNPEIKPAPVWPSSQTTDAQDSDRTHLFLPDPLVWDGEGFQGFAVTR